MKKKFALMKLMTIAMSVAVVVIDSRSSVFWGIGEPQLPENIKNRLDQQ